MKKMILTCTLITMYLGAAAQNDSTNGTNTDRNKTDQTEPNQSGTQNQDQNQDLNLGQNQDLNKNQDQNKDQNQGQNKNKQGQTQDQNKNQGKTQNGQNKQPGMNQCVVSMDNGKVMVLKNGKKSMMTKDSTLQNGSMLMANGFVKMKDGTTLQLKQGDCMDVSGKIIPTTTSSIRKSSSSQK